MRGLKNKRIVVAGGSTGIGAALARRLAEEGAKLVVGGTSNDKREATVAQINAAGGVAVGVHFDLADTSTAHKMIELCVKTYGGIDGLANIGADHRHSSITQSLDLLDTPEDHWRHQFDCNFMGYGRTIKAALPYFVAQRRGAIVNTSASSAWSGEEVRPAYGVMKDAVHSLTRHVARRWGPDNIRCNCVVPATTLVESVKENMSAEALERHAATVPLRRPGEPEEVAAIYAFLLSDDASWVTGQAWAVNGGRFMRE